MKINNLIKENNPGIQRITLITIIFFVITFINLIPLLFQRIIFDKIIPSGDLKGLVLIIIGIIISNLISIILTIIQDYISSIMNENIIYNLKTKLIKKFFKLKESFIENKNSGEMNRVIDDTVIIGESIKTIYFDIIKNIIIISIYLPIMLYINVWLSLLKFIPFVFVYFFGKFFGSIDRKFEKEIWKNSSNSYLKVNEIINGYKTIKILNLSNLFFSKLKHINLKIKKFSIYRKFFQYLWNILGNQIETILNSIIFFISCYLIMNNKLTFGSFILFNIVSSSCINGFSEMFNIFKKLLIVKNPINRYYEIIDGDENKENDLDIGKIDNIIFQNVSFSYGNELVLNNINLNFERRKKIAIVGGSGSGKSTIVKLLLGFYDNYQGNIILGNRELRDIDKRTLRNFITIVMQEPFFFNGTLKENIVPNNCRITDYEIYKALKITNSLDFISKLPNRLNTYIGTGGINLSGGQKQRLSIVRSILSKCPFIVFDEATSGLDPINDKIINNFINNHSKNKTIISIVHKLNTIENYDLIYVVSNGRIVESGTHLDLINNGGNYYELYRNIKCS